MELINVKASNQAINFLNLSNDYCIKGTNLADEGMLEKALEIFDKAIETNPNNHVAYFNRATIKIDLGDLSGAKSDFNSFDLLIQNIDTKIKGLL